MTSSCHLPEKKCVISSFKRFIDSLQCVNNICLVCSVRSALKLLNNALNKSKASLSLLCETYSSGHTKFYLRHLFDVLWEAYLHTEEALCKAWADQPDFSPNSPTDLKEQCQASAISHSPKICALYSEYQIPPKTSRCICVACCSCVLSLQSAWLNVKGQVLEFGRRTKSTVGNLTFK